MRLPRELILAVPQPLSLDFTQSPIQLGLRGSPWHVAVASIALCRVRRSVDTIERLFIRYPSPSEMALADDCLGEILAPLGLQHNRARAMQRMSFKWYTTLWLDLRDLNGIGSHVADAVSLFCFGITELESYDTVLHAQAERYDGPSLKEPTVSSYASFVQEMWAYQASKRLQAKAKDM